MTSHEPATSAAPDAPAAALDPAATAPVSHGAAADPESTAPSIRQPAPPKGLLAILLRLPIFLYRAKLGRLLGHRALLLVHTGRRTGIRRQTVLEVVCYDRAARESIVAAGWGRRTQWLHNVEAGLALEVVTGGDRFVPSVRVLPPDEAERVLAGYERRNRLIAPVVRWVLGKLVGWRYDGSPAARRRVVAQLPLIAFRPRLPAEARRAPG